MASWAFPFGIGDTTAKIMGSSVLVSRQSADRESQFVNCWKSHRRKFQTANGAGAASHFCTICSICPFWNNVTVRVLSDTAMAIHPAAHDIEAAAACLDPNPLGITMLWLGV